MEAAMASYSIAGMRAISPFYAAKLKAAGIRTTTRLLERANSPRLRKQLSEETKISLNLILDWANIADLTRVSGVALTYAELLAAAGVDTVKELKRRNAGNLVRGLAEVNAKKGLVELLPSEKVVASWIARAKLLEPVMSY
jgi:hypothetical protein